MNTDFVFIEFSTISCLSLINSCCCSVLAKAPPAHDHKYNPSQPCQELYYSCGPNTRPENGMSTLQTTVPCLPWLCNPQETAPERQIPYSVCIIPKKKANKQNKKNKTVSCVKVLWQDGERIIFKDLKKWYFEPSWHYVTELFAPCWENISPWIFKILASVNIAPRIHATKYSQKAQICTARHIFTSLTSINKTGSSELNESWV